MLDDAHDHEQGGLEQAVGQDEQAPGHQAGAVPMPNSTTMNPSWLTVPKASSSLRSLAERPQPRPPS